MRTSHFAHVEVDSPTAEEPVVEPGAIEQAPDLGYLRQLPCLDAHSPRIRRAAEAKRPLARPLRL
jgi:hypothetical protein